MRVIQGLLILSATLAAACGNGGSGGTDGSGGSAGTNGTCSGMQCTKLEDCPGISCTCPGIRFPVTIQACKGGCCPANCAEACPTGGSGGGGGGSADAGADGNFLTACPAGSYDIDVDWMLSNPGNSGIVGTISLPANVTAGSYTQLVFDKAGPGFTASQIAGSFMTQAGATDVKYRLRKLPDGNYYLRFRVDQTGNMMFGDPGDFEGYYNGSVAMPIASKADAPLVTVNAQCRINADFGVGSLP
jgi:hypothetical protein